MKKPGSGLLLFVVLALMVAGMTGFGGNDGPTRIPAPDKNYGATVVDLADVRTELTMFTIGGYTHFFGQRGKGQLAIPFDIIKRADFRQTPDGLEAVLQTKDGQNVTVSASRKQECYGRTRIGNFVITLGDVKSIVFGQQIPTPNTTGPNK